MPIDIHVLLQETQLGHHTPLKIHLTWSETAQKTQGTRQTWAEQAEKCQRSNKIPAPNPHLAQRCLDEAQGELLQFRQRCAQLHMFGDREAQVQA